MDKIKLIITGSDGFIGSNMKKYLTSLDEFSIYEINESIFDAFDWKKSLEKLILEIQPEFVFHIGACSNTLQSDVNYIMLRNVEFTKVLCSLSKKYWFKVIYSSSASVYGYNNLHPSNLYGWTKYISEEFVKNVNGICLRYFNVYGPGEQNKGVMSSLAYQSYIKHKKGEPVNLFPGKPKRDFIHIEDVISSNLHSLKNFELLKSGTYDVGTAEPSSFEEVLQILEIPFGYTKKSEIPNGYQFFTCSSKEKWMNEWYPKFNLLEGLKDYKNYLTLNE